MRLRLGNRPCLDAVPAWGRLTGGRSVGVFGYGQPTTASRMPWKLLSCSDLPVWESPGNMLQGQNLRFVSLGPAYCALAGRSCGGGTRILPASGVRRRLGQGVVWARFAVWVSKVEHDR
jgi:hypothetical protein